MYVFYILFNITLSEESWMLSGYVWILPEGLRLVASECKLSIRSNEMTVCLRIFKMETTSWLTENEWRMC